jgi:hypothetical protein
MNIHTKNTPSSLIAALLLALCASFAGCGTGAEGQTATAGSPSNANGNLVNIASHAGNTAEVIDTTNVEMKVASTAVAADTANQAGNLVLVADDPTKPWVCRRSEEKFYGAQNAEMVQIMPLPATLGKCDSRIIAAEPLPYPILGPDFRQPVLADNKVVN